MYFKNVIEGYCFIQIAVTSSIHAGFSVNDLKGAKRGISFINMQDSLNKFSV